MPFVVVKYQKCGKERCKCQSGHPHGPYFWLCSYIKSQGRQKRKTKWTYLGKDADAVQRKLQDKGFGDIFSNEQFTKQLSLFHQRAQDRLQEKQKKSLSQRILKI